MVTVQCLEISAIFFTDQTGRFPTKSSKGSQCVMITYDLDSNAIIEEPIKSHAAQELLRAMTSIHTYLKDRGLHPRMQILDNECPELIKKNTSQGKYNGNLCLQICTAITPPKIQTEPSKITSLLSYAAVINNSLRTFGIDLSGKPKPY